MKVGPAWGRIVKLIAIDTGCVAFSNQPSQIMYYPIYSIIRQDWGSTDVDSYEFVVNGTVSHNMDAMMELGTYNALLAGCPLYTARKEDFNSSHKLFKRCFNKGFAWELLELFSGQSLHTHGHLFW